MILLNMILLVNNISNLNGLRSKTTLNYRMMVKRYPNLKEEVGGLIPAYEISSLHDGKLVKCRLPPMLWRWHVNLLSLNFILFKKKLSGSNAAYQQNLMNLLYSFFLVVYIVSSIQPKP
jgi:hypothetical protein